MRFLEVQRIVERFGLVGWRRLAHAFARSKRRGPCSDLREAIEQADRRERFKRSDPAEQRRKDDIDAAEILPMKIRPLTSYNFV